VIGLKTSWGPMNWAWAVWRVCCVVVWGCFVGWVFLLLTNLYN